MAFAKAVAPHLEQILMVLDFVTAEYPLKTDSDIKQYVLKVNKALELAEALNREDPRTLAYLHFKQDMHSTGEVRVWENIERASTHFLVSLQSKAHDWSRRLEKFDTKD
ncbi:hypothetical protein KKD62_01005 [Patescibacteria group bacterium]|nr:hypothetical protein [Patescibacteria group bacterium]MBU1931255.1 hypothetical protein [Patescibacteria group bacterium]